MSNGRMIKGFAIIFSPVIFLILQTASLMPANGATSAEAIELKYLPRRRPIASKMLPITLTAKDDSSQSEACIVQFVEKRSCRPISAPPGWHDFVGGNYGAEGGSSGSSDELDAVVRHVNAPWLRHDIFSLDPDDSDTFFVERPVVGQPPGTFTLQTLQSREYICVNSRGRLRLQQHPRKRQSCWWRFPLLRLSDRPIDRLHRLLVLSSTFNQSGAVISASKATELSAYKLMVYRLNGAAYPAFAPKIIPNIEYAVDTFLFRRHVAPLVVQSAAGFGSNCAEAIRRQIVEMEQNRLQIRHFHYNPTTLC